MDIRFRPETESRLQQLAAETGQPPDQLVEDVVEGYIAELAHLNGALDRRYDEIKSGRVKPVDGEQFFEDLRREQDAALRSRSGK